MHQMNVIEVKHQDHVQHQLVGELDDKLTKSQLGADRFVAAAAAAADAAPDTPVGLERAEDKVLDRLESVCMMSSAAPGECGAGAEQRRCSTIISDANHCAGCQKPIRDKFIFSVIDLSWHQDCVQCADCSSKLNDRCYTVDGKLYCKLDYRRRFGPKCFACKEPIGRSELVQRIKGNRVYHLKCFTCDCCQKRIMAGEQLHLLDDARLLCKRDFNQYSSSSNKSISGVGFNNNNNNNNNSNNSNNNNNDSNQKRTTNGLGSGANSNSNDQQQQNTYYTLTTPNDRASSLASQAAPTNAKDPQVLKEHQSRRSALISTERAACERVMKSEPIDEMQENDYCEFGDDDDDDDGGGGDEDDDDERENLDDDYNEDDDDQVDDDDDDDDIDDDGDDEDGGAEQDADHADLDRQIGEQVRGPFRRRLQLGYEANDNENDENHSRQALSNSLSLMTPGSKHKQLKRRAQRQYQQQQQCQVMLNGAAGKSKRARRRQQQKLAGISEECSHPMKKVNGNRTATNSAGESILNSLNQSASILATNVVQLEQGSTDATAAAASVTVPGHHQVQQQQQQQQQQLHQHQHQHQHITSHLQQHNNGTSQQQPPQAHLHNQQSQLQGHHHANHNHNHNHNQHQLHLQQPLGGHNGGQATKAASSPSCALGGGALGARHNGSSAQNAAAPNSHKPTRVRTVLNEKQLQTLRDCYAHNPRPDALMKEQLVDLTGLSPRVIRVWFQNKRCKDKKKSILYKQMQQNEKDGRHLTSLMRGVHLVASSPIQYDDHSTVSSLAPPPPPPTTQQLANSMLDLQAPASPQQALGGTPGHAHAPFVPVQSPTSGPAEIHSYQPPWKSLVEYAAGGAASNPTAAGQAPADVRPLNAASPRYQQLMGQIHGYNSSSQQQTQASQEQARQPADSCALLDLQRAGAPGGQFQAPAYASSTAQGPGQLNSSGQANPADQIQMHLTQPAAAAVAAQLHQFQQS